jgi:hypothetical protein
MATALTSLLGTEIKVFLQPRKMNRQFTGFAGVHGMTSMEMGTTGFVVDIEGVIRRAGVNYAAAYAYMMEDIDAFEALQFLPMNHYTYNGATFQYCVFHNPRLLRMASGKQFSYTMEGYMIARFSIQLIGHV